MQTAHVSATPPPQSPPGRVEDARVARSRRAVLSAGVDLLVREGWSALTHQRVAREADVGRATVYRHWPDPKHLLIDVLEHALAGEVRTISHVDSTRDDLVAELTALAEAINDGPTFDVIVTLIERADVDSDLRRFHERMTRLARRGVWSVVRSAIDRGELDPELDEVGAAAQTIGPLFYRRALVPRRIRRADVETVVDAFLDGHRIPRER